MPFQPHVILLKHSLETVRCSDQRARGSWWGRTDVPNSFFVGGSLGCKWSSRSGFSWLASSHTDVSPGEKWRGSCWSRLGAVYPCPCFLMDMKSSGCLDLASLCGKAVLLFEEPGNYCSEHHWKETSWFCALAAGNISCLEPCRHVGVQWWIGHTEISYKQKSPPGEVKLHGFYSSLSCTLLSVM